MLKLRNYKNNAAISRNFLHRFEPLVLDCTPPNMPELAGSHNLEGHPHQVVRRDRLDSGVTANLALNIID